MKKRDCSRPARCGRVVYARFPWYRIGALAIALAVRSAPAAARLLMFCREPAVAGPVSALVVVLRVPQAPVFLPVQAPADLAAYAPDLALGSSAFSTRPALPQPGLACAPVVGFVLQICALHEPLLRCRFAQGALWRVVVLRLLPLLDCRQHCPERPEAKKPKNENEQSFRMRIP